MAARDLEKSESANSGFTKSDLAKSDLAQSELATSEMFARDSKFVGCLIDRMVPVAGVAE